MKKSGVMTIAGIVFVTGCLMYDIAWGAAKPNLLSNPGFESGMGTDVIDSWQGEGDHEFRETAGSYGYTLGEGTFPEGKYALKMFSDAADVYQGFVPVTGNTKYYTSAYFYHSSSQDVIDASENSLRAFVHVEWFNADNHLIREDYTATHNGTMSADKWVLFEAELVSPGDAVKAKVHLQTDIDSGGGSIFADMIYFGER